MQFAEVHLLIFDRCRAALHLAHTASITMLIQKAIQSGTSVYRSETACTAQFWARMTGIVLN